ncbi:cytochrome c oxidase assembly protein COX16 homolog, mitochondrial [Prorops nasuta]|uniref:cytochrome c oxidase assembly protein COX16 homolog, mitochondrial n=1 Tax=Prorops nasuta TaxID=863751 RepID=UPI0034CD5453
MNVMDSNKINASLQKFYRKNKFALIGLPVLVLTFIGSYGLREISEIRYKYRKHKDYLRDIMKKQGIEMKPEGSVTLETEYEKIKEVNINNWENKRIPRPWGED